MEREKFSGRFGLLVAMSGSAVGLGNIWRFPFLVGENGGAGFILIYIGFILLISLPILFAEFIVGRRSRANVSSAFFKLSGSGRWRKAGAVMLLAPLVIVSYYSVVGGWSVEYLVKSCTTSFSSMSEEALGAEFASFITAPVTPLITHTVFLLVTAIIVLGGVRGGIEKFSKLMMPLLFVIVILIGIRSLTLPGAGDGVRYLMKPDFSGVSIPEVLVSALGQSFFSLSLGCGAMLTYASYVDKNENIGISATAIAFSDLLFALLAAFAVMPAVFAFSLNPSEGPGLVFQTLPYVFSNMTFGKPLSILFFFALLVAALTSAISMLEAVAAYLIERWSFSRRGAVILLFFIAWILGILCSLSFGPLKDVQILGNSIFDFCDKLSSNFLLTVGSLLTVLFVGWKMKREDVFDELTNGGSIACRPYFRVLYILIRYIAPLAIVIILINNLL